MVGAARASLVPVGQTHSLDHPDMPGQDDGPASMLLRALSLHTRTLGWPLSSAHTLGLGVFVAGGS